MAPLEQLTIDREVTVGRAGSGALRSHAVDSDRLGRRRSVQERRAGERAAREDLRAQIARLEGELSGIVAGAFPHIACAVAADIGREAFAGPRLLTLAELERLRDGLSLRVREAQRQAAERADFERRSRALLEKMRLEPGRYKFMRLPVANLGEGGCGVWEVRPRLGLVGMLAGWWELKLSSGCPLA